MSVDSPVSATVDNAAHDLGGQDRLNANRLRRWRRQSVSRLLLPGERVAKCYRVRTRELVDVLRSRKLERAHYGGLATCASVWSCPVCASKITERRRVELQLAVDRALERGMSVFMVTWTMQHHIDDNLNDVRDAMTKAMRALKAGRFYQVFIRDFGIVGNVTGTEVKYGSENGWHYHRHSVFFSSRKITDEDCLRMQSRLSDQYRLRLEKLGRYADAKVGLNVQVGDKLISDYIAKFGYEEVRQQKVSESHWSISAEVTKGLSKDETGEHYIPFQLLDLCFDGDDAAGQLFKEYAKTMKGYNQLRWSDGLREMFDLGAEVTDEEIASAQDDDAYLFAQITISQWRSILRHEKRGHLLEVASTGNLEWFQTYISTIK